MNVIQPMAVNGANLIATNVVSGLPSFDRTKTYEAGDEIQYIATPLAEGGLVEAYMALDRIEASDDLTENVFDAETNPSGQWQFVGLANQFKPFDQKVSDAMTNDGDASFTLRANGPIDAVAIFGAAGEAATVRVARAGVEIFAETKDIADTADIIDWYEYHSWEPSFVEDQVFVGLPAQIGDTVSIELAGNSVRVGEIVMGKLQTLGITETGTVTGFQDFSRKGRDTFGNAELIERDYADTVDFHFRIPYEDLARVKRIIRGLRATPAVWFARADADFLATIIYGWPEGGLRVPIEAAGYHAATLEIEGLT